MLLETLQADLITSMKAKDKPRTEVLRSLVSELKRWKVDNPGKDYTDDVEVEVLRKAVKQRKDSIAEYTKGNRQDLADKEQYEAEVIEGYLPALMDAEAIREVVRAKMEALGVSDKSGMGKLMGAVMGELKGQADGNDVRQVVQQELG